METVAVTVPAAKLVLVLGPVPVLQLVTCRPSRRAFLCLLFLGVFAVFAVLLLLAGPRVLLDPLLLARGLRTLLEHLLLLGPYLLCLLLRRGLCEHRSSRQQHSQSHSHGGHLSQHGSSLLAVVICPDGPGGGAGRSRLPEAASRT